LVVDENGAKFSIEFVLNVLRQHENDLDRLIAQLDLVVDKFGQLTDKIQRIADNLTKFR
jgi:ABC-type transporter Mla subunit MlaD